MAKKTTQVKSAETKKTALWIAVVLLVIVGVAAIIVSMQSNKKVDSFQSCKDAGGAVMETYPETCSYGGSSFVNESQATSNPDAYVGLSEVDALNQAARGNKPARVVERDGESLPADSSFVQGRLNFYVKDGKVTKVQVEN